MDYLFHIIDTDFSLWEYTALAWLGSIQSFGYDVAPYTYILQIQTPQDLVAFLSLFPEDAGRSRDRIVSDLVGIAVDVGRRPATDFFITEEKQELPDPDAVQAMLDVALDRQRAPTQDLVRAFACPECSKRYTRKDSMLRHVHAVHR